MSEFEGHGRGLVDNRPRMPEHADDSPTGSENLAQVVESEQATRFEAALHKVQALVGVGPTAHDQVVTDGQE